ncbi:hypothetical protein OOT55_09665 [Marinimicrobium sp. C6131]|uniref:hypothetical protein n=1 Tax=Marinimicrobium sp. C6131 TaxID=3022676 RepID=UPI00223CD5DE|nr:hypothetical protein [Marinimicrobium sp. C6131]UZJ42920.1 hypothetical protein OOT55_09665 [Marinimicrobium sp. C6131]
MKNLIFKRAVFLSDTQRSANQFVFHKKYNLITGGKDHSAGKTSLVKSLLWGLGCQPHDIPDSWKALDCKSYIECDIGGNECIIYRYQNTIKLSVNGEPFKTFPKITGNYSSAFASLVGFSVLLPNRPSKEEDPELETPPPAYYFLPFYIDQKKGWSEVWNGFDSLGQYSDWKRTVIKFHTGYLPPEHFDLEEEIYDFKKKEAVAQNEVKRIDTALAVVDEYVPKTNFTINEEEFERITDEVKGTLQNLSSEQEIILSDLSNSTAERYHLGSQMELLAEAALELEEDYKFSVENIDGDELECPLCGTHHDNTIIDKAEILADKKQLESQSESIRKKIRTIDRNISDLNIRLSEIRDQINTINQKYSINDLDGNKGNLSNIVDSLASNSVKKNVSRTKEEKQLESKKASDKQRDLKKEQRKLLTKTDKDDRNEFFMSRLESHISKLSASGVSLNAVKSPIDHKKLLRDGGAAESTRAILAYHASVMDMIKAFGSELLSPFIVDTPRQHEQNDISYKSIIELIMNRIPTEQQVFLCALDDPVISDFKNKAKVITLNNKTKLLGDGNYEELRKELDRVIRPD